ncbi:uncharacterized protein LOC133325584 [Musca vetustissima]|uniref:uncharacterized protein LOC133325584 n=1 Tax=Musca vetustissima TaxID=27455 RepID=UPI002AB6EB8A|nr:uncharacterized protein LOC133325584 [Musca vetustissima]
MLNKLQFNNMVISNKKGIQQARIQTINKLVHKIRKLKTLLEKRPEDSKCKERIRKSTETMEHLKKLKRAEIMKCVLLLEKPPAAVITNGSSTPDEMAAALLAMNKVMQGLIKRFKLELKLEDSDSAIWKEELRENSKRRQKIERTEEKKRKRQALKEQKAMARNRQEWLEQNCPTEGNDEANDGDVKNNSISTVSGWKIEEVEENILPKEIQENKKQPIVVKETPKVKRPTQVVNGKPPKKEVPQKKPRLEIKTPVVKVQENIESEHESDQESIADESFKPSEDSANESETEETTHVVDPFFVTETGENYLSTAVVNKNAAEDNHEVEEKDRHLIQLNGSKKVGNDNRRQDQQSRFNDKRKPWSNDQRQQKPWNNDQRQQKSWPNDQRQQKPDIKKNVDNNNEKLHPSWAAKQKLKPVITGFQGKKIVFGEDNDTKEVKGNNNKSFNNANKAPKENKTQNQSQDNLHPSWAAKQKLKPVITAFQGKKICFDNDD